MVITESNILLEKQVRSLEMMNIENTHQIFKMKNIIEKLEARVDKLENKDNSKI